eukprot:Gb_31141 [translate_table: standard]
MRGVPRTEFTGWRGSNDKNGWNVTGKKYSDGERHNGVKTRNKEKGKRNRGWAQQNVDRRKIDAMVNALTGVSNCVENGATTEEGGWNEEKRDYSRGRGAPATTRDHWEHLLPNVVLILFSEEKEVGVSIV